MTTPHTPGPWFFALYGDMPFGQVETDAGDCRVASDVTRANGHLIAAAPGMLAALRLCCDALHVDGCTDTMVAFTTARAAIAAATGATP